MPLRLNTDVAALSVGRQLNQHTRQVGQILERLSSGLRLNSAADDAAGLSVREGLRSELAGLGISVQNAEQATNLIQVAEGSLNEVNASLVRLRELATQAASSTLSDNDRSSLQSEFSQLVQEIDRIAQSTTFNDQVLLTGFGNSVAASSSALTASNVTGVTGIRLSGAETGTFTFIDSAGDDELTLGNGVVTQTLDLGTQLDSGAVATGTQIVANFDRLGIQVTLAGAQVSGATGDFADGDLSGRQIVVESGTGGSFQVGPADAAFNRIEISIPDLSATGTQLNLESVSVASLSTARAAITSVDSAISRVAGERGNLGAAQNRLSFNIASSENAIERLQASESSLSDADIAAEVTRLTRAQILAQSASSLLVRAGDIRSETVLRLLQIGN